MTHPEDEADPVVQEYPVHLVASADAPELFLLQHPVRAATRGPEPYVRQQKVAP